MAKASPKTRGYIYFAGYPNDIETVKIGFTTDIDSRMTTLSTGSPYKLEVQQFFAAYAEAEKLVHERFAKQRIRGEWFHVTDEIGDLYDDILDYQMMHLGEVEDTDEVFFNTKTVKLILGSIGREWPPEIAALRN